MTPEQTFTLWTTALAGLQTVAFTGWIAYWTWRRDQERIIVQKSPVYWETIDGTDPDGTETDATLCGVGIVVTNLSLYPVRIVGLGFRMNGKHALAFEREKLGNEWPSEIASHTRTAVYTSEAQWRRLVDTLGHRGRILDRKFVAVAVTATGNRVNSDRLSGPVLKPVLAVRGWLMRRRRKPNK